MPTDPTPSKPAAKSSAKEPYWGGEGRPPSREAALAFAKDVLQMSDKEIAKLPKSGTLTTLGEKIRQYADQHEGKSYGDVGMTSDDAEVPTFKVTKGADPNAPAKPTADEQVAMVQAAIKDGKTPSEAISIAGIDLGDIPTTAVDTRGAALLPYDASDSAVLSDLGIKNESDTRFGLAKSERDSGLTGPGKPMIDHSLAGGYSTGKFVAGARYFEQDTLEPIKWTPERRADLQLLMHQIGLYGDAKTTLGRWDVQDQQTFAELLTQANVSGLTWVEQLAEWRRHPPLALLDKIKAGGGGSAGPQSVTVTSPTDILKTGQDVSQSVLGRVDAGIVNATVSPYQSLERGAGTDAVNAAGTEGSVLTAPPSVSAFVEDKIRREHPIEADGYSFLGQFQSFMQMLGVQ